MGGYVPGRETCGVVEEDGKDDEVRPSDEPNNTITLTLHDILGSTSPIMNMLEIGLNILIGKPPVYSTCD